MGDVGMMEEVRSRSRSKVVEGGGKIGSNKATAGYREDGFVGWDCQGGAVSGQD